MPSCDETSRCTQTKNSTKRDASPGAPGAFRPERFTAEQVNARPRYAYFPFGGGPRQCIGMPFALMEAPLILAMLMQAFSFRLLPGETAAARPVGTLRPGSFRMALTPLP